MNKTVRLGDLIEKSRIKYRDFEGNRDLEAFGVSNVVGITRTTHRRSDDLGDYLVINPGSFAYNPFRVNIGSIGLTPAGVTGVVSPAYVVFRAKARKIVPEVLLDFLKSPEGLRQINQLARGAVRKALRYDDLCEIEFPAISYQQQLSFLKTKNGLGEPQHALISELAFQQSILAALKQSIIQDAIQGKLTVGWRAKNPDVEPASRLLRHIKNERDRLIAEKKIRKQQPLPEITPEEIPFEIPENWEWCRLGFLGAVNPRNNVPDEKEVSFVPMSAIPVEYKGEIKAQKRLWKEIKTGYTHIADGVVASAKITPCFENGKAAAFRNLTGSVGTGTTELHVLRPILAQADYLLIFLKSPLYIHTGIPKMTGTAGQKRVPLDYFTNALVPIPPMAEQTAIVKKVDSMMKICHDLETEIEYSRTEADALPRAALKEIFATSSS